MRGGGLVVVVFEIEIDFDSGLECGCECGVGGGWSEGGRRRTLTSVCLGMLGWNLA